MMLCKLCDNLREYIISLHFKKVCACFFVNLRILSAFWGLLLCKMQRFSVTKQRVVLLQTTCYFTTNDVLFYYKRRVVSLKMNMLLFGCCDTCDSKKTKILQDARVYVCVARGEDRLGIIDSFCCVCVAKIWVGNLETPFFCRFFTLLPHIYPYSIRGRK